MYHHSPRENRESILATGLRSSTPDQGPAGVYLHAQADHARTHIQHQDAGNVDLFAVKVPASSVLDDPLHPKAKYVAGDIPAAMVQLHESAEEVADVEKFNPNHDERGRFSSGSGGGGTGGGSVAIHAAATHLHATAQQIEPEITGTLSTIAKSVGGQMEGLDFRFKSLDGILEKVNRKVRQSNGAVTPEQAVGKIADALRYTMTFGSENHSQKLAKVLSQMNQAGYHITSGDIENSWRRGDAYNGVNGVFTHPSGMKVEIQFHTPESWNMKQNVNHGAYEQLRTGFDLPRNTRLALHNQMVRASDTLPIPDGMLNVGQLIYRPFSS